MCPFLALLLMAAHYVTLRPTRRQRVAETFSQGRSTGETSCHAQVNRSSVPWSSCGLAGFYPQSHRFEHVLHRNRLEPHFAYCYLPECFTLLEATCIYGTLVHWKRLKGLIPVLKQSPLWVKPWASTKSLGFLIYQMRVSNNCQHFASLVGRLNHWKCVSNVQMYESTQMSSQPCGLKTSSSSKTFPWLVRVQ